MAMLSAGMYKKMPKQEGMIELDNNMTADLQSALLKVLIDIDEVCEQNGFSLLLGGGSCLGAVRHRGFIPWDDDVDLIMPRTDWRRFRAAFEERFGDRYLIHEPGDSQGYDTAFPRVFIKGTRFKDINDIGTKECGVFVDIFLADAVPDGFVRARLHGIGSLLLGYFLSCVRYAVRADAYLRLTDDPKILRSIKLRIALGRMLGFKTPEQWAIVWDNWNRRHSDKLTKYVTVPTGRNHYFKETQKRTDLFPAVRVAFCGTEMPIPANSDAYLRSLYGSDYMTPPPVEDRETHVLYEFDLGEYGKRGETE